MEERYSAQELADLFGLRKGQINWLVTKGHIPKADRPPGRKSLRFAFYGRQHREALEQYLATKPPDQRYIKASCSAATLAAEFSVSVHTIYGWVKKGHIPRPGGTKRFPTYGQEHRDAIRRYLDQQAAYRSFMARPKPRAVDRKSVITRLRADVWDTSNGECHYCSAPIHPFRNFHVDHVIPVSKGGKTVIENLVASCRRCNIKKGAKDYQFYKQLIAP